ncbi:uncharacterized protein [Dermacentor andersoni]|uniref:uncharacterized protein n=1 Tax=Dermacentor andersoni TaxID=34620 RepID=UPI003B3BB10B
MRRASLQPVLAAAITLAISEEALAELIAHQFALAVQRTAAILPVGQPSVSLSSCLHNHHPGWASSQITAICQDPLTLHDRHVALKRGKCRSAPGAEGVTTQMLRHLAASEQQRLLDCYNDIWRSGQVPETWRTVIVAPILKAGKPAGNVSSYQPVSLTSITCKVMLWSDWTGWPVPMAFWPRSRAKACGDTLLLVLVDIKGTFDGLPHPVVQQALDLLGINGNLRRFISSFLQERTFRVRVGQSRSSPRPVAVGVPQGLVVSPFLFNLALAWLPAALLIGLIAARKKPHPPRHRSARSALRRALDTTAAYLSSIGLAISARKTEAKLLHPRAAARHTAVRLHLGGAHSPWSTAVTYLGLHLDHRLSWLPAVKTLHVQVLRDRKAVSQLLARRQGCTTGWALRQYDVAATSRLRYALSLVALPPARLMNLDLQHRADIRLCLSAPRSSQVAATLTEAGAWPLLLLLLKQGLRHVDRLHHGPDGSALLSRLRSRPHSQMGRICGLYEEVIGRPPANNTKLPPPQRPPIPLTTELPGVFKRRSPTCALQQTAASLLHEDHGEHLQTYVDGSVMPDSGSSTAACVVSVLRKGKQCRLPDHAPSTAAEVAGLLLAVDLLTEELPATPVTICCDSKVALLSLQGPESASLGVALLSTRLMAHQDAGCSVSLHCHPAHVGTSGNEEAGSLAKRAHHCVVPPSLAVTVNDFTIHRLRRHLLTCRPDKRMSLGRPPRPLPQRGLARRDTSFLLRLRIGCCWTGARRHRHGLIASLACASCGERETVEHLLLAFPAYLQQRGGLLQEIGRVGLLSAWQEEIFLGRNELPALLSVVEYLDSSELSLLAELLENQAPEEPVPLPSPVKDFEAASAQVGNFMVDVATQVMSVAKSCYERDSLSDSEPASDYDDDYSPDKDPCHDRFDFFLGKWHFQYCPAEAHSPEQS